MRTLAREVLSSPALIGEEVTLNGWVHFRRDLGGIKFIILRDRSGTVQCVISGGTLPLPESCVSVLGVVSTNERAPGGVEVRVTALTIITAATLPAPVEVAKEEWRVNPETLLDYRYVSLRGLKERAVLRVQAEFVRGFRDFLTADGFTEIFTPKIVSAGAEGGANLFKLDYFGVEAYLAQSPQVYKQIMVGVYERVFETAPVYRAEQHATPRHLNEYLSLDLEFGFISGVEDVMDLEERLLNQVFPRLAERCRAEFETLNVKPPAAPGRIPRLPLAEARALVESRYGYQVGGKDLDPEGERLLSRAILEDTGNDFVFVTAYPKAARPFYAYPDENGLTRSFDLIYRGLEVTTGGQRIHEYEPLVRSLTERGMNPAGFGGYLEVFQHGMPPHGGLAIGAERITAKMLGVPNVRYARAFPRDRHRLTP